ncbi:hypothetical protein EBZ80_13850 [bacterium]|nr:hypothetical protein [bacterium]
MKRYHEEKHIIENRVKRHRQINSVWLEFGSAANTAFSRDPGRYRKTLRCSGCTRARCQVCHPEKYPKRIPTRQEKQNWKKDE